MSRYNVIPSTREQAEIYPVAYGYNLSELNSFELDKTRDIEPHRKKYKKCCFFLFGLAVIMASVAWFVDENHIIFYQSIGFLVGMLALIVYSLRALKQNIYIRLTKVKRFVNLYFFALIVALVVNQVFLTLEIINYNSNHCGHFKYNKVCDGRWGLMSDQAIFILFYPIIDMTVFIVYRYFILVTKEYMNSLLSRNI